MENNVAEIKLRIFELIVSLYKGTKLEDQLDIAERIYLFVSGQR